MAASLQQQTSDMILTIWRNMNNPDISLGDFVRIIFGGPHVIDTSRIYPIECFWEFYQDPNFYFQLAKCRLGLFTGNLDATFMTHA